MIEPLARLRLEVAQLSPGWRTTRTCQGAAEREILRGLAREGSLQVYARGNRLLGFVLAWREPNGWTGGPLSRVMVEVEPEHPGAADWAADTVDQLSGALNEDLDLRVNAAQRLLRERLVAGGLGVDSVTLVGAPGPALVTLLAHRDPPLDLRHLGLELAPLAPRHLDAVMTLYGDFFAAHPQFCWFGARPGFLRQRRADLARSHPAALRRVVLEEGRVVGMVAMDPRDGVPGWGRVGGMDLLLAPAHHGRGIAAIAYRILLEHMVRIRCDVFKGGTAQPAVLHLGRVMGRVPFETNHRRRAAFPPSHFARTLDGAPRAAPLAVPPPTGVYPG